MKRGKAILIALVIGVVCFMVFVLVDCVRISKAEAGAKPIITISEEIPNGAGDIRYRGLGYSVVYKMDYKVQEGAGGATGISYIKENAYGQEIWLFDKVLLWGWVE